MKSKTRRVNQMDYRSFANMSKGTLSDIKYWERTSSEMKRRICREREREMRRERDRQK